MFQFKDNPLIWNNMIKLTDFVEMNVSLSLEKSLKYEKNEISD